MNKLICYKKCSTCSKAKKFLEEKAIEYEWRDIDIDNPTFDELKEWIDRSGLEIKKFYNTSGLVYRENKLKDKLPTMSDDEKIELLSTNGMLVKRPLYISKDKILVGFKEKEWEEVLG